MQRATETVSTGETPGRVARLDELRPPPRSPSPAPEPSEEPNAPRARTGGEAPTQPPAAEANRAAKPRRRWLRPLLFALLPVALVAGGYEYVTGGAVISTENAYVGASMTGISTDVAGTVEEIAVHENQAVKTGQLLYRLRDIEERIALDGAQAQLQAARNQVLTLKSTYEQNLAQIQQAEADLPYYESAFKRQQDLSASAAASRAAYDQAKHDLDAAREKVRVAKAAAATVLAQLGGDATQPVESYSFYRQAQSAVDKAQKDLDDTVVRAPFDGVVTNVDHIQVGTYLQASQTAFNLVDTSSPWIAANPKETELTNVRPGQKVQITIDTYPGVTWTGTVQSISPASGASFALLPAQNTSGNWVKVVQRIPMRITVDDPAGKPPLRVGMSAVVDIETGHARGLPEFLAKLLEPVTHHV